MKRKLGKKIIYSTEKVSSTLSRKTCGSLISKTNFLHKTRELYSKENPEGVKYSVIIL